MIKIVLTGGPCAGKTDVMKEIARRYVGKILLVPEAATMLLGHPAGLRFPMPGEDLEYCPEWQKAFQASVLAVQRGLEASHALMAAQKGAKALLLDRGALDGAAYTDGGLEAFLHEYDFSLEEARREYNLVIGLQSVASFDADLYERLKASNPARMEGAELAAELDRKVHAAYAWHSGYRYVSGTEGIEAVKATVLAILQDTLGVEVERKFRLRVLPNHLGLDAGVPIRQGYLPDSQGGLRLRQAGERYFLTVKGEGSLSRSEWEEEVPGWVFEQLWPATEGRRVDKIRHTLTRKGCRYELDVFQGRLEGLILLECEAGTEEEVEKAVWSMPAWAAGQAEEVTENPAFQNRSLAQRGKI